ncbi:MAG: YegS/Rv2252/BmrU family lipid kinase [Clostridia bacterium]|nr:YegS/Rv2252/BmrU family lipid kinase [Clostridia bacterium]
MKKVLLIINPMAGTRQWRRTIPEILTILNQADYLPTVYLTRARGDGAAYTEKAAGEYDLVAVCGGDGTLNEVISGLIRGGHHTTVGYLPAGSTNDFASGIGISSSMTEACQQLVREKPRELDVGRFGQDGFFSYTASFGLFTAVYYTTSQAAKNILGHAAYILEGIRSLADVRPVHLKITADDGCYENDYLFGAVCNSTSLGGILKLADHEVHMSDGLFESLLIPFPSDLLELNRVLTALRSKNYNDPRLIFIRSSRFEIDAPENLPWTLDGEEASASSPLEIVNLHQAVRLVCPS